MNTLMRRERFLPDLLDWLEEPLATMRPHTWQSMRFEDYIKDGRYVLRVELPGIDPEKDVEIDLTNGVLTIHAERREEHREQYRTEFRYGSFTRSISLPQGADENDVKAVYDQGILEVSVRLAERRPEGRHIPIQGAVQPKE
ncbi:Hsp20/alpha crystallin family protein [Nonomuraea angiospora]|uniref:Hsp20/alpha crystallin family protein n=1 Tax=Nonomuraea angiospora TaxID=46172 RepID=UPI00344E9209